ALLPAPSTAGLNRLRLESAFLAGVGFDGPLFGCDRVARCRVSGYARPGAARFCLFWRHLPDFARRFGPARPPPLGVAVAAPLRASSVRRTIASSVPATAMITPIQTRFIQGLKVTSTGTSH